MAVEGNYITETDIATWAEGTTVEVKQARIALAEELVEQITGQVFYVQSFDIRMNGNGLRRLFIPLANPIVEVTALYFNDDLRNDYSYDSYSVFGLTFPKGISNIRIVGTCGVAVCPEGIKQACIKLVDSENDPVLYQQYFFKSERSGEYSYTYADTEKILTGLPEVDSLLRHYKRRRLGVL